MKKISDFTCDELENEIRRREQLECKSIPKALQNKVERLHKYTEKLPKILIAVPYTITWDNGKPEIYYHHDDLDDDEILGSLSQENNVNKAMKLAQEISDDIDTLTDENRDYDDIVTELEI